MKFLSIISRWYRNLCNAAKETREQKRRGKLENLSCEVLNVMEFDGRLYVAYNGVPIVRIDDLKVKAPDLLAQSRADYLAWKAKFDK